MIFRTRDGYESSHLNLNGVTDLISEGQCECEEGYDFKIEGIKHISEDEKICRYCYMEKYSDQISIEEKVSFVQDCLYDVVDYSQLDDYGYEEDETNEMGEYHFGHTCDECGNDNVELVEGKYFLCTVCKNKR